MPSRPFLLLACAAVLCAADAPRPFDLIEALPLTERIAMVHMVEGHAVHHRLGQKRGESHVELTPLDVVAAAKPESWTVRCAGDPAFAAGVRPERIGRKSKGVDFAWMVQGWDQQNNRAVNKDPDHAKGHWLYLVLPQAMQPGLTYVIDGSAVPGVGTLSLAFAPEQSRSEAVHVNLMGHVPDTAKYAYVHHWAGDLGSLDLAWLKGRKFSLIEPKSGKAVFTGEPVFRAAADQPETQHAGDTPKANYLNAEVWQCDFTAFTTPGTYVVSVDGVGCSFPFAIGADVYREAFRTTARGLYHNRSGIALEQPYTEFTRPAPANPLKTPGFAGKMVYTTSPLTAWKGEEDPASAAAAKAAIKGPLDVWGFYQDAGDWDGYLAHLNVASALLFTYEMAPRNFSDSELNIPESGNGVPDILDEAAWLPRFGHRLRHALLAKGWGTGGIGLRVTPDWSGKDENPDGTTRGSWQDDRVYIISGEDHHSTMRYAATAAHLAHCLALAKAKDPEGVDWLKEAVESYAWAQAHASDSKEPFIDSRMYAAAALFRLTGDAAYEQQLADDTAGWKPGDELWWTKPYGAWIHCLGGGKAGDPVLLERLRSIVLQSCEIRALETSGKRALRWGGGWSMPMLVGQQTTPWIMEGMVGHSLLKTADPAKAKAYRDAVATTCDYFLGTNALNMTWVTGLGVRHVQQVFHMDAWYNGKPTVHPGIVPYGPWRDGFEPGQGPWDGKWPNTTVHPAINRWPGNERWFENRNCPLGSEFTVHQTTCWAAATFGWMCGAR